MFILCIYCYEQDRPMINMNEKTERAIMAFVRSNKNLDDLVSFGMEVSR